MKWFWEMQQTADSYFQSVFIFPSAKKPTLHLHTLTPGKWLVQPHCSGFNHWPV